VRGVVGARATVTVSFGIMEASPVQDSRREAESFSSFPSRSRGTDGSSRF
jgi:hypothetical protein